MDTRAANPSVFEGIDFGFPTQANETRLHGTQEDVPQSRLP